MQTHESTTQRKKVNPFVGYARLSHQGKVILNGNERGTTKWSLIVYTTTKYLGAPGPYMYYELEKCGRKTKTTPQRPIIFSTFALIH